MAYTESCRSLVTSSVEKFGKGAFGSLIDSLFSGAYCYAFGYIFDRDMNSCSAKMLSQPWFIEVLVLAAIHQIMQKVLGLNIPILDSYFDPLLFMPILLHLILWERRFLFKKGIRYVLPWGQILSILIFVSVLCEYLFPGWNNNFTMDYWDIVCYTIGALIFGLLLNIPLKTTVIASVK